MDQVIGIMLVIIFIGCSRQDSFLAVGTFLHRRWGTGGREDVDPSACDRAADR